MQPKIQTKSYLLATIFFVLGITAAAFTMSGNFMFGHRMALTETGQIWQGGVALYVDAMVAALAIGVGFSISRRMIFSGLCLGLALICFAGASGFSIVGLSSMERINKTRTDAAKQDAINKAVLERNSLVKEGFNERQKWLRSTFVKTEGRAARAQILAEMASDPRGIEAPEIQSVMSDPQAEVAAEMTGLSPAAVQKSIAVVIAVLLVSGKTLCFAFSGIFWPVSKKTAATIADMHHASGPARAHETDPDEFRFDRPNSNELSEFDSDSGLDADDRLVAKLRPEAAKMAANHRLVTKFLDECTVSSPGGRIRAADIHDLYCQWAEREDEEHLTPNQMGRLLTAVGLQKKHTQDGVTYMGYACRHGWDRGLEEPERIVA